MGNHGRPHICMFPLGYPRQYPLVNVYITIENITMFHIDSIGKSQKLSPCSIANSLFLWENVLISTPFFWVPGFVPFVSSPCSDLGLPTMHLASYGHHWTANLQWFDGRPHLRRWPGGQGGGQAPWGMGSVAHEMMKKKSGPYGG